MNSQLPLKIEINNFAFCNFTSIYVREYYKNIRIKIVMNKTCNKLVIVITYRFIMVIIGKFVSRSLYGHGISAIICA